MVRDMASPPEPSGDPRVDLHGATLDGLEARLEDEIRNAFQRKAQRLVIVHGAGNHREDGASPLARRTREWLKSLAATPNAAIRRLEFGEESADLSRNPGCVRVTLCLQLARGAVVFRPAPRAPAAPRVDRKRDARRVDVPDADELARQLRRAEDTMEKRYGPRRLDAPHRPPSGNKGEWPGH